MIRLHAQILLVLLVGVCVGYSIATSNVLILGLVFSAVIILFTMMLDPFYPYVAVIANFLVNPSLLPPLFEIGDFTFRITDVLFSLLIFRLLLRGVATRLLLGTGLIRILQFLLLFLAYIGLTLLIVAYKFPSRLSASTASYLRLLETFVLLPATYMVLRREKYLNRLIFWFVFGGMVNVLIALWQWYSSGVPFGMVRVDGLLGINSLGLASGLMVILGIIWFNEQPRRRLLVGVSIIVGLVGLSLAKSISSTMATVISLGLYFSRSKKATITAIFRKVGAFGIALPVGILIVWWLRTADIMGLIELSGGSLAQRLAIMYGGLQIFADNPILGIGWQASTGAIGALDIELPYAFHAFPAHYFEAIRQTSLHNMYIQFLAELGLVGVAVFIMLLWQCFKEVTKTIRLLPIGSTLKTCANISAFWLVAILIWWNTNSLFPGQIETVIAMVSLGSITAIEAMASRQHKSGMKPLKATKV